MKTEQNKIPEATQAPPHLAMQQMISGFWVRGLSMSQLNSPLPIW
jgi:hypothetical protein